MKWELVHAIWCLLINKDFICAYKFGIITLCADGIKRCLFLQFFTYLVDYPEKYISFKLLYVIYVNLYIPHRIILSTIRFLGDCLCPLCTCVKEKVRDLGMKADEFRRSTIWVDSQEWQDMVEKAQEWIFQDGQAVTLKAIDNYLGFSMIPIHVIPFPEYKNFIYFRTHSLMRKCLHPVSFMNSNLVSGNKYLPIWYGFSMLVMKGKCRYWMNSNSFEIEKKSMP